MPPNPCEIDEDIPEEFGIIVMDSIQPAPGNRCTMESIRNRLQIIQVRLEKNRRAASS